MLGKVHLAIGQVVAVSDMHKREILQNEATGEKEKRRTRILVQLYKQKPILSSYM